MPAFTQEELARLAIESLGPTMAAARKTATSNAGPTDPLSQLIMAQRARAVARQQGQADIPALLARAKENPGALYVDLAEQAVDNFNFFPRKATEVGVKGATNVVAPALGGAASAFLRNPTLNPFEALNTIGSGVVEGVQSANADPQVGPLAPLAKAPALVEPPKVPAAAPGVVAAAPAGQKSKVGGGGPGRAPGGYDSLMGEYDAETKRQNVANEEVAASAVELAQQEADAQGESARSKLDALDEYKARQIGLEQRKKQELRDLEAEDDEQQMDARYAGIDRETRKALESTIATGTPEQQQAARAKLEASREVDPSRWWASRSTGQTIAATIGILMTAVGDALAGRNGPNGAVDIIERAIDRDIGVQREKFQDKRAAARDFKGRYGELRAKYGDEETALEASKLGALDLVSAQLEQAMARLGPGKASQAAMQTKAEIDARRAEGRQALHGNVLAKKEASGQWREEMNLKWAQLQAQQGAATGEVPTIGGLKLKPGSAPLSKEETATWRARMGAVEAGKQYLSRMGALRDQMPVTDFVGGRWISPDAQAREAELRRLGNDYINTVRRVYSQTGANLTEREIELIDPDGYLRNPAQIALPGRIRAAFTAEGKSLDRSIRALAEGAGLEYPDSAPSTDRANLGTRVK